jgi:hypothetical protein
MQDTKPCYETAEQNLSTRFETAGHGTFALPYNTLLLAHLTPATAGSAAETLTLVYSTHTVTIHGSQLSSLLTVVQKGRAETVRVGGNQPNATTPAIREIIVAEGAPQTKPL